MLLGLMILSTGKDYSIFVVVGGILFKAKKNLQNFLSSALLFVLIKLIKWKNLFDDNMSIYAFAVEF